MYGEGAAAGRLVAGRYRLTSEIGHGGMGRVWAAHDTQLDRVVAAKEVLLPALPPAQQEIRLQQALREGKNAAAFADHPNVVSVYDVVVEAGSPWIIMQLVNGRSLRHVLRDPAGAGVPEDEDVQSVALGVPQVVRIAEAMLDALGAMHSVGLVHRDVKPHNIMLADDGRVLLTDFGIAKSDSDATVTVSGSVMGTMAYLAPERAEGEPGTPASDLFSLGVTLFEAVEGFSPFERKNSITGTLTAILTKPLPPMTKAGPLAPLISALTLKLPEQRPDNVQARALLAQGHASGWAMPAPDDVETAALPPTAGPTPNPMHGAGPRAPWESVTLSGSAGLPRPPVISTPQPTPDKERPTNLGAKVGVRIASVLILVAIAVTVSVLAKRHSAQTSGTACATWRTGMTQHNQWVRTLDSHMGDNSAFNTYMATEEDRLVSVETQAESQAGDKTLRADFQQAASDHQSLAAVFRNEAADGNTGSNNDGYNQYFPATNHDDVDIQSLCNKS